MGKQAVRGQIRELGRKLADYRTVLKQDVDYDWTSILWLLKYKLERTRKSISAGLTEDRFQKAAEIKQVEALLARVAEDRYFERLSRPFRKRYGNLRMTLGKALPGASGIPVSFKFRRETPRNRRRIHKQWSALHAKAYKLQSEELRLAFEKMRRNIRSWWD